MSKSIPPEPGLCFGVFIILGNYSSFLFKYYPFRAGFSAFPDIQGPPPRLKGIQGTSIINK